MVMVSLRGIPISPHFLFHTFRAYSEYILKRVGDKQQPCFNPLLALNPLLPVVSLSASLISVQFLDGLYQCYTDVSSLKCFPELYLGYAVVGFLYIDIEQMYLFVKRTFLLY